MKMFRTCLLAITVAAAAGPGIATPAAAGPMPVVATALQQAVPDQAVDVRYRRRNGGALIAGAAVGLIGGLIASQAYRPHYDYYYGGVYPPAYYPPAYYPPAYYAPAYYPPAYGPVSYGPYYSPPVYYPAHPYAAGPYVVYRRYPAYRVHRPIPVNRAYGMKRVRRSHR